MTRIDLPWVQRMRDRHGRVRHYFRKPGARRASLPGEPGSASFMAAYQAALAAAPTEVGAERTAPGTIDALVVAWYASLAFRQLADDTRRTYRHALDRFREAHGGKRVAALTAPHVRAILDGMADRPGAARNLRKRLAQLMDFAIERGQRPDNPVRAVKPPRATGAGFRPWTEDDIALYERTYPEGTRERLALALLLYTGQRRSDVVAMGRQHVRGQTIRVSQFKGRARAGGPTRLRIPVHPALAAELARAPADQLTFLLTAWGQPFSHAGFTAWFAARARAAGLPAGSTPHGLRKAAARRLAEAGCTSRQIAAVTGHRTIREVEHYTEDAEQARLAEAAMGKLTGEG